MQACRLFGEQLKTPEVSQYIQPESSPQVAHVISGPGSKAVFSCSVVEFVVASVGQPHVACSNPAQLSWQVLRAAFLLFSEDMRKGTKDRRGVVRDGSA